jgi:hypothetical protein
MGVSGTSTQLGWLKQGAGRFSKADMAHHGYGQS